MILRKLAKASLLVAGGAGITLAALSKMEFKKFDSHILEKTFNKDKEAIYDLSDFDHVRFPWETTKEDWEFRKVRLTGVFGENKYLVRRERNGQPGYLVFMPFMTSMTTYESERVGMDEEHPPSAVYHGIMVNIGWIPAQKVRNLDPNIKIGTPVVITPDDVPEGVENFTNPITGISTKVLAEGTEPSEEDPVIVSIEGYIRRGEKKNVLMGKWNSQLHEQQNLINLRWMTRFEAFENVRGSHEFYIERAVENLEDLAADAPQPLPLTNLYASLEHFENESRLHKNLKNMALYSAVSAVLGLVI